MATKTNTYPKKLYVVVDIDGSSPIWVGVTQLELKIRRNAKSRVEYIDNNKSNLTWIQVDTIHSPDELVKEVELMDFYISRGYRLYNRLRSVGAGITSSNSKVPWRYRRGKVKLNSTLTPKEIQRRISEKNRRVKGIKERVSRDKEIVDMKISGMTHIQIAKSLNTDQGHISRVLKRNGVNIDNRYKHISPNIT